FMIGTALSFLDVHPIFRYFVIQPPRFLTRYIRGRAKSGSIYAPAFIGFLSIFIPCGTTQAMMALAAASGNPWWGMAIMTVFVAGTAPLFFLLGISIDVIKATLKEKFGVVAATLVFVLALVNFNAALTLYGSPVTIVSAAKTVFCSMTFCPDDKTNQTSTTTPEITFWLSGYEIENPVIPAGQQINLTLKNIAGSGCVQAFTIPAMGLYEVVPVGETKTLSFRAPEKSGTLAFSCSMGMYGGSFTVR
ncbi:MAG TPA: sulfite exporter TauE/SafE family protein, partial [Patescibacteria group bacterium]|nr:sulfite exporter TauE/SafE family protein [Patescibacteria group bacterium]